MMDTKYPETHQHASHHSKLLLVSGSILSSIVDRGHVVEKDITGFTDKVVRHMLMDDIAFREYLIQIGHLDRRPISRDKSNLTTSPPPPA